MPTLKGVWVPKRISNDIFQLVCELNTILKGNYFVATLIPTLSNLYIYQLDYTVWAWNHDTSFSDFCIRQEFKYNHSQMKAYLIGLIKGLNNSLTKINN